MMYQINLDDNVRCKAQHMSRQVADQHNCFFTPILYFLILKFQAYSHFSGGCTALFVSDLSETHEDKTVFFVMLGSVP